MKVVFYNPSHELLDQLSKKFFAYEVKPCNEIELSGVTDIKDMRKISSCDFAFYLRDCVIYADNSDFSSMEVQL